MSFISLRIGKQAALATVLCYITIVLCVFYLAEEIHAAWFIGTCFCVMLYDHCSMCLYLAEERKADNLVY